MGTIVNSTDLDASCIISLGSTPFAKLKLIFRERNIIFKENLLCRFLFSCPFVSWIPM